jgi:hypothetical protein
MWNWQHLECDGIGASLMPDTGCGAWFIPSTRLTNRQARKRGLKEFTPSLLVSALRGRVVPHRCGGTHAWTWTYGLRFDRNKNGKVLLRSFHHKPYEEGLQVLMQEIPPVDLERRQVSHALSQRLMRLRRTSCLLSDHRLLSERNARASGLTERLDAVRGWYRR